MLAVEFQEDRSTALCFAADRGHEEAVTLLLQYGAKVNHQVSTEGFCHKSVFSMRISLAFGVSLLSLRVLARLILPISPRMHYPHVKSGHVRADSVVWSQRP